jgi:hypothetical protein
MISRRAAIAAALLAVLTLALAAPVYAGAPKVPPSIDDVEGFYVVSGKYLYYETGDPVPWKGSYKGGIRITVTGPNEVLVEWTSTDGLVVFDDASGQYFNGVLLVGEGDDTTEPADDADVMILWISGAPGKLKLAGTDIYYDLDEGWVESDILKGKQVILP